MNSSMGNRNEGSVLSACFKVFSSLDLTQLSVIKSNYRLSESQIHVHYASPVLYSLFQPVIKHLISPKVQGETLNIYVLGESSNTLISETLTKLTDLCKTHKYGPSAQPIFYYETTDGHLSFAFNGKIEELYYYNRINKTALAYFSRSENHTQISPGSLASPFRTIFSWYFAEKKSIVLHAAALGYDDGAALILGPNGAGKSTVALSCLEYGMLFAGDDSVLVSLEEGAKIYCMYLSAKLYSEDLPLFRNATIRVQYNTIGSKNKVQLLLSEKESEPLLKKAPLKAIIFPKIDPLVPVGINRLSPHEALEISASSCLAHIPNNRQKAFSELKEILISTPCYRLSISDRSEIGPAIKSLLDSLN